MKRRMLIPLILLVTIFLTLEFISIFGFIASMLTLVFVDLFLYYRKKINLEKDFEVESEKEKLEEEKRKKQFPEKFPKISKIPVLNWIIKWMYKEGWCGVGLLLIVLIGAFFRFCNLDHLSLWGDEGTVYIAVKNISNTGLPYLETGYLYLRDLPHLYITSLSYLIFGKSEFALRFPSALSGTMLIIVMYVLSNNIINKRAALLIAAVIAFHPWIIEYSRVSRSYILMLLFFALTIYYFLKIITKNKLIEYILFALFGSLSCLTHQTGQTVLFLVVPYLFFLIKSKGVSKNLILKMLPFMVILFSIFIYKFLFSMGYYHHTDQFLNSHQLIQNEPFENILGYFPFSLHPNFTNLRYITNIIPFIFPLAIAFLIIFILNWKKLSDKKKCILLFSITLLFVILFSKKRISVNRAVLFLFPVLSIITGIEYFQIEKFVIEKYRMPIYFFTIFIIFSSSIITVSKITFAEYGDPIYIYHSFFEGFTFRQDNKTTYEYVNKYYKKDDVVIVYGIPSYAEFYANFKIDYQVWTGSTLTINGNYAYTNTPQIRKLSELKDIIQRSNRIWIITSYAILYEPPRVCQINEEMVFFLNKFDPVYVSKDRTARVYLIQN